MMAGVGPRMIEAAGEVADRFACHSFTSPADLREVIKPALAAAPQGRGREPPPDSPPGRLLRLDAGRTPAVLDHHGHGGLHEPLHAASRRGEWVEMGEAIDDDVLETYCVREPPDRVAGEILRRYRGLADRVSFYYLGAARIDWKPIVAELQAAGP